MAVVGAVEEFERQAAGLVVGALVERLGLKTTGNWVSLIWSQGWDLVRLPSLQIYLSSRMFWRVNIRHPDIGPSHHLTYLAPLRYSPFLAVSR